MSDELKNKLLNFEESPSPRVWEEVQNALSDDEPVLHEKLFNYAEQPASRVWNKIENNISKQASVISIRRNYSPVIKYSLIAAALFLIVIAINLLVKPKHENEIANGGSVINKKDTGQFAGSLSAQPTTGINSPVIDQKDSAARYVTVAHVDGTKVRLSKKVFPEINCAQNTSAENWSKCKENIQALQAKMATSVNGSADFGGLLDMLKDLEENH
jgi:hypothetical protein